jgi:nucleotide-binding universal stress UspA family protein
MTTILVTTDFSSNSKSGIRFAIQLASQMPCKLVFYSALELMKPTSWSKEETEEYVKKETHNGKNQLNRFLKGIFKKAGKEDISYEYEVEFGMTVDSFIINYAQKINANYICMSTRGAGALKKIIGTNASTLVNTSPIPMIVVPRNYRAKSITKVGYSSDFENIDKELALIKTFTEPLKVPIDVYHFNYKMHDTEANDQIADVIMDFQSQDITFHIPKLLLENSLVENLQKTIKKEKPSILAMFTNQKHNWLERLFLDSKTADMTFDLKIPLLAFKK